MIPSLANYDCEARVDVSTIDCSGRWMDLRSGYYDHLVCERVLSFLLFLPSQSIPICLSIYLVDRAWILGPENQDKAKSAPPLSIFGGSASIPSEAQGGASPQSPGLSEKQTLKEKSADDDEKKAGGVENTKATATPKKEVIYRNSLFINLCRLVCLLSIYIYIWKKSWCSGLGWKYSASYQACSSGVYFVRFACPFQIASRLPLVMGKTTNQTKLIFEIDSEIDLEGDAGVVGRVKGVGPRDLLLDLKGTCPLRFRIVQSIPSLYNSSLSIGAPWYICCVMSRSNLPRISRAMCNDVYSQLVVEPGGQGIRLPLDCLVVFRSFWLLMDGIPSA